MPVVLLPTRSRRKERLVARLAARPKQRGADRRNAIPTNAIGVVYTAAVVVTGVNTGEM